MTGLRGEVRDVLAGESGRRALAAMRAGDGETDPRPVYELLGRHRLLAANWPVEYGGRGVLAGAAAAVVDELIAAGVSDTLHTLSVQICGTFLLSAGTAEQRAELLPALARGHRFCTVLYTEPTVGSDLSTLTTRAEPVPGGWALTGRKVYSVRTRLADVALVAARTSEEATPYQGITLFLLPLDTPGVTVDVLPSMANEAFGDVTLRSAFVPDRAVVGPVGGAWPLITGALALERTGVDHVAKAEAWLRTWQDTMPVADPVAVGTLRTKVRAARALSRRCVAELDRGRVDPALAAATKLWCGETAREVGAWCGSRTPWTDGPAARLEAAYREAPGLTISAGTSELMLEVVAGASLPGRDITPAGEEPVLGELRAAVRAVCGPVAEHPTADDPVVRAELAGLGVFGLRVPAEHGGTDLGLAAALVVCEEAGAALTDGTLLDTMTAVDALGPDPALLKGDRAAALVWPGRPVTDPGRDGLLLVVEEDRIAVLPADRPVVRRSTALGEVSVFSDCPEATTVCSGDAARAVLAADLLRRAAALVGVGLACLVRTVRRARARRQFGRALIENQVVAFRLAQLAVHAQALRALIASLADDPDHDGAAGAFTEAAGFASRATAEAVQLHGAFGMVADSPVARHYRFVPLAVARGRGCPVPTSGGRL